MPWTSDQEELLTPGLPPFRTGDNDVPDPSVLSPWQYLHDCFVNMMRAKNGEVHTVDQPSVRWPSYLSPVHIVGRYYDVSIIDRRDGRHDQQPLSTVLPPNSEVKDQLAVMTSGAVELGVPEL